MAENSSKSGVVKESGAKRLAAESDVSISIAFNLTHCFYRRTNSVETVCVPIKASSGFSNTSFKCRLFNKTCVLFLINDQLG